MPSSSSKRTVACSLRLSRARSVPRAFFRGPRTARTAPPSLGSAVSRCFSRRPGSSTRSPLSNASVARSAPPSPMSTSSTRPLQRKRGSPSRATRTLMPTTSQGGALGRAGSAARFRAPPPPSVSRLRFFFGSLKGFFARLAASTRARARWGRGSSSRPELPAVASISTTAWFGRIASDGSTTRARRPSRSASRVLSPRGREMRTTSPAARGASGAAGASSFFAAPSHARFVPSFSFSCFFRSFSRFRSRSRSTCCAAAAASLDVALRPSRRRPRLS
mmetsp:Transcript_7322/g.23223  ORF Transcript_7322/g.23223 Transcript_7322/m.23223 type:complete len:277 (+) Transcript_7322:203-1033(+)